MKDLLIGCFINYEYYHILPWVESINKVDFPGYKYVIVSDISKELSSILKEKGFTVIDKGKTDTQINNIVVDRFFDVSDFLKTFDEEVRYVISTDVRDVIFQRNPSEWLEENMGDAEVVVSGEGFKYEDEPWSRNNMITAFGSEQYEFMRDKPIHCAGVIAGTKEGIIRLFDEIWFACQGKPPYVPGGGGPDQSAFNIILNTQYDLVRVKYTTNDDTWACQLGTTVPAIKAGSGDIGHEFAKRYFSGLYLDEVKQKMLAKEPKLDGKTILNNDGKPYYIIHQYDRIPEWRDTILERDTITIRA
ncbi:MAG: hypothetical protein WD512_01385 [Candidatus Paceibacterota bacterium]